MARKKKQEKKSAERSPIEILLRDLKRVGLWSVVSVAVMVALAFIVDTLL